MRSAIARAAETGLAAAILFASSLEAQGSLRIRVTDAESGRGLNAALVTVDGPGVQRRALTDSRGAVTIAAPSAGRYQIVVTAAAYKQDKPTAIESDGRGLTELEVKLTPDPIHLKPVTASASPRFPDLEKNGFYDRRDQNRGFFIDQAMIQERNQRRLSDLLRFVPGVQMVSGPGNDMAVWFQGNETFGVVRSGVTLCGPRIILNGLEMDSGSGVRGPTPIDNLVPPSDLAGIEVYRRPSQLPARFGGAMSACGVIVLWTRLKS